MADKASIAIRGEQAMQRLTAAAEQIAAKQNVAALDFPTYYRSRDELPVMQLEAIADWLELLADPDATTDTTEVPAVSPYASLTRKELEALATERKLTVAGTGAQGNVLVDDLRAALDADDAAQAEGA